MNSNLPESRVCSSVRSTGGLSIQLTLAAIALGAAATPVIGDILDFESLPYPTTYVSWSGGTVSDPLGSYMGFKFGSVNFLPPDSPYTGVWFDYTITSPPDYSLGYPYGINGGRALGVPMAASTYLCSFSVEREDSGEWMFGGAQFSPVHFPYSDV